MFRKFLFLVFILIISSLAVIAQEELPADANACNEGGSMAGKCNIDFDENGEVNEYEVAWAWACGWYIIRYERGIFAEVPSWCQTLLPSEPVDTTSGEGDVDTSGYCTTMDGPIYVIYDTGGDGTIGDGSETFIGSSETDPGYPKCIIGGA